MPAFGQSSLERLETCDPRLQDVMHEVIKIYDVTILEGKRSWKRQRELLHQGKSKVQPGESKHTSPTEGDVDWLSLAVDVAPYPIDWQDSKRFVYLAGIVMGIASGLGYTIRWGGNWDMDQVIIDDQSFDDLPHFELVE